MAFDVDAVMQAAQGVKDAALHLAEWEAKHRDLKGRAAVAEKAHDDARAGYEKALKAFDKATGRKELQEPRRAC